MMKWGKILTKLSSYTILVPKLVWERIWIRNFVSTKIMGILEL